MYPKYRLLLTLAILLMLPLSGFGLPETTSNLKLAPLALKTTSGNTGGQSVGALRIKDQSGAMDDWNKYVEFTTPATSVYAGYRTFIVPAYIAANSLTALQVAVNFRGPQKASQGWKWHLYDWNAKQWVWLGDNSAAPPWVWTTLTFKATMDLGRFVHPTTRQIRLRLTSSNASDDADLDYEAITLTHTSPAPTWWQPAVRSSWQIQYSGAIDTSLDVQIYNLDGADTPKAVVDALHARGIKVMCYFSAGSWEEWRDDADDFPPEVIGKPMADWPDERWLDISQLETLRPIMEARMQMCQDKGFDGVDPDNVDGYTNDTGFPLTSQDQLAYNRFLAAAAHARGLAVGLKNDIDQTLDLLAYFDWQLNEQCFVYNECSRIQPFVWAGKPVFNIEYQLAASAFCARANAMNFNSLKKNLKLDAARQSCR